MRKSRIFITLLTVISSIFCIVGAGLWFLLAPIIAKQDGYVYYLRPGLSKRLFISELQQKGIVPYSLLLSLYIYPQKNAHLKTGEYLFRAGSTPVSIWRQVTTGTGLYYRPLTIIPGWTFAQLRRALFLAVGLRHTTVSFQDKQIMEKLGHPDLAPEGEFFPETYYYTRGVADLVILKHAFELMQSKLNAAWETRSADLPYQNKYEALTAASMIEKEAYLNSERPIISGVLINRLKKDMLLQIDATVIYGLGARYDGKIYKENLLEDTPYNTYVHKGLTPTPISIPSMPSIEAAVHPQQHDYFYYVAKGDGSHHFSKTLDEHNTAVHSVEKVVKLQTSAIRNSDAAIQKICWIASSPYGLLAMTKFLSNGVNNVTR